MKNKTTKRKIAQEMEIPFQIPHNNDNAIESDYHLLISNSVPAEMIPLETEEGIVPGVFEEIPGSTIHKLFVGEFMEEGKGFYKIVNKLQEASLDDELEMHIASFGGSVQEVIMLGNVINSLYTYRCTTYLNYGYSGGAMTFVMGNERIIYEHSDIMFHFFSGGERGKGSDMLHSLTHSIKSIKKYYHSMLNDYFSEEELDLMINHGREYWLNSREMLRRGIATGIIKDGAYYSAKLYLSKYKKNGELTKKYLKKQIKEQKKLDSYNLDTETTKELQESERSL